jgi:putative RNA 2'-phosphotransferase
VIPEMTVDLTSLSKLMSFVLRHAPEMFGLSPDEAGWVDLESFVQSIRSQRGFERVTRDDVTAAIGAGSKRRHEVHDGKIRAMYGHSIEQKIEHTAVEPPALLYHGTVSQVLPDISANGLIAMRRQYVHLSSDPKTAWAVAARHGANVVLLKVRAHDAHESGVRFYNPWEVIWLADVVPPQFIELA